MAMDYNVKGRNKLVVGERKGHVEGNPGEVAGVRLQQLKVRDATSLWVSVVCLSLFGAMYLSHTTWMRYQSSPTVVSMERDMFAWNTTFPAITICIENKVDEGKLENYIRNSEVADKSNLREFINALANASFQTFESLPRYRAVPADHYMRLILELAPDFKPDINIGAAGVTLGPVSTITEMGLCYSFNSKVAIYNSPTLSIGQRRCRFPHENNLKHNAIYTYTLCRMECRIKLCLKYCGCVPHFYRTIRDEKTCDIDGLHCLANYKDILYKLRDDSGKKVSCECYPICDDINYVIQTSARQEWFLGTNLQWGIVTYPRMRYRRDIIFGFTDVLVAVGGMAGLFLGCSVLSFTEIVYFLSLRLYWYCRGR
ncbi:PREDICTED: uncharacterized protein LOC106115545 [Papilio xuthus]|uniref:Uncharacterized protein LOC106115545 n=1 Tax=Papilio xuthus TaxID=66420 RepID=A0AAJ7E600_PAPXU|nr:PREDICTED: uncharacterized protein LOC106115545 [Papilio xuthus]